MKPLESNLTFTLLLTLSSLNAFAVKPPSPIPYQGSSFNQVMQVISDKGFSPRSEIEAKEFSVYKKDQLPQYPVSYSTLGLKELTAASKRTLVERADYFDRIEKMVHANGVCVSGEWNISENSGYSGYFANGSQGLFVGRISVALGNTTSAGRRGFGLAGKIFPTMDPNQKVKTTNFFVVDVLSGTNAQRFLDVSLTNNPPLTLSPDIAGVMLKIFPAFRSADSSPTFRPITPISQMGVSGKPNSPVYLRLSPEAATAKNNQPDFRQEIIEAFRKNNGQLNFNIDVSRTTNDRLASKGWSRIGQIRLNQVDVSYGCDRRLHFNHPKNDKSNELK
jgi:hypothetical protein